MSDTLRDQLLNLGFKPPAPAPARHAREQNRNGQARGTDNRVASAGRAVDKAPRGVAAAGKPDRNNAARPHRDARPSAGAPAPNTRRSGAGRPRNQADIDLAKAYAIRAQKEKEERIAAEAAKQEEARQRREARAQLAAFMADKGLNATDADIARHFPYGGKIKRVYVTSDQLRALNAGELGVVQQDGRYILVAADVLVQAEAIFPACVALRVDPNAAAGDDPYSDPEYQVPDDLVW